MSEATALHGTWVEQTQIIGWMWDDRLGHAFIVEKGLRGWSWGGITEDPPQSNRWHVDGETSDPFPTWQEAAANCEANHVR